MFEVLIREAAARFGVGDKALPLVQMLLAAMTTKDTGGLAGFLEKFKAAGLGPLVQSWLGGGENAQPIGNTQVEAVLGTSGGLLPTLTAHLDLPRDQITEAIGYLLPALVGRLTPGGVLPANVPADVAGYAQAGQGLLTQATQAVQVMQRTGGVGGNNRKWLVWVVVIVIVLAVLYAWSTSGHQTSKAPPFPIPGAASQTTPPAHTQPPLPGAAFGGSAPPQTPPASAAAPASAAN
ncbi:MAG: YidB family protein [Burkholderiaceae bacterium]|jgi:uncharacterized protein YidB (DUF937 family)|nr:YidB family protein [Burkholderiaceae bacterium]